jgi:hypothetical protein
MLGIGQQLPAGGRRQTEWRSSMYDWLNFVRTVGDVAYLVASVLVLIATILERRSDAKRTATQLGTPNRNQPGE